jgi:hypothetical protein
LESLNSEIWFCNWLIFNIYIYIYIYIYMLIFCNYLSNASDRISINWGLMSLLETLWLWNIEKKYLSHFD